MYPSGWTIQIHPNAASVGRTVPAKNEPEAASDRVELSRSYLGSIMETWPVPSVTQTAVLVAARA